MQKSANRKMMKLSQTLLFIVGSVAAFFITVISSAIIAYAFPNSSSLILSSAVSPELKIVEADGGNKYQLHIMNSADEVEVYCHEGTQPEIHNHDGLYALHCYE
ncbi:MAG: hypothetical protein WBA13_16795 [Microcoleaceae cyanobacterium]